MDITVVRDVVERTIRPGQMGSSVTVNRGPAQKALAPSGHAVGNRYDVGSGENLRFALYGRGRYGVERYARG